MNGRPLPLDSTQMRGLLSLMMSLGGAALSDQESYDVAAYFTRQPRPDFKAKSRDWPNGDKPRDVRY
jgi:thiosulfate dehydrogenase